MSEFRGAHETFRDSSLGSISVSISSKSSILDHSVSCKLDKANGFPIIAPLDNLEQVLSWQPCNDGSCMPNICLRSRLDGQGCSNIDDPITQKTIVCHDMMGGYLKDRYIQGHTDVNDYYFYQWQYIDAFIYFSHHFISLPPHVWTNVAHKNGVLSMGTIITEWEEGAKLCHKLLSDEWKLIQFSNQLVAMAKYYRFDGWLVNIENPIHPLLLDKLYMLLSLLTTGMHASCPGSKVIWYDSITVEGQLKWQNQLNPLNKPFFDLCDGIFLNYNWSESGLASSRAVAGDRKGEVYVGVDVFGRGCYGGGGFNTYKAVEVIHQQRLSVSLFAPGWIYETQDKEHFFQHQERFWSLLTSWINAASISTLPLVSSFGRGCGEMMRIDGKFVCRDPWTNHSAQDIQTTFPPSSTMINNDPQSAIKLDNVLIDSMTAYNNGSSLRFEGTISNPPSKGMNKPALARLFKTNLVVSAPLLVGYTYKESNGAHCSASQGNPNFKVYLQLHTTGTPARIFLDPFSSPSSEDNLASNDVLETIGLPKSNRLPNLSLHVLVPLTSTHTNTLLKTFTGDTDQRDSWITKYFIIDPSDHKDLKIKEISLGFYLGGKQSAVAGGEIVKQGFTHTLGELKVVNANCVLSRALILSVWSDSYEFPDNTSVSLTLSWISSDCPEDRIEHFNIYSLTTITSEDTLESTSPWKSHYVYHGCAYTNSFRITLLYLPKVDGNHSTSINFIIQPVTVSRQKLSLVDLPSYTVKFCE